MTAPEELLRATDPASRLSPTPQSVREDRIHSIVASDINQPRFEGIGRSPRRHLGWLALLLAIVLVAVIGVNASRRTALWLSLDRGAWANQVLEMAAANSADPVPAPDQFWQITIAGTYLFSVTNSQGELFLSGGWIAQRSQTYYLAVDPMSVECLTTGEANRTIGTFGEQPFGREPFGGGTPTVGTICFPAVERPFSQRFDDVPAEDRLPTVIAQLTSGVSHPDPARAIEFVGENWLASGQAPADFRAALYRYIADLDGVKVLQDDVRVGDHAGIAIGIPSPDRPYQYALILDADNGDLLGFGYGTRTGEIDYTLGVTRTLIPALPAETVAAACQTAATWQETSDPTVERETRESSVAVCPRD